MSALVKIVPGYWLKTHHHVVAPSRRHTSCQWSSHSVPGSSRNGSHPPSRNSDFPRSVGASGRLRLPRRPGASSSMPVTRPQWRIDETMFLPTPSFTIASSAWNAYGSASTASTAFLSHVYRNGKVSCPENDTRAARGPAHFACLPSPRDLLAIHAPSSACGTRQCFPALNAGRSPDRAIL